MRYLLCEHWGGSVRDAKKTASTRDDLMCWAASAANVLAWTGWGTVPGQSFDSETAIFAHLQDHLDPSVGYPHKAWQWWFNGTDSGDGDVEGGGFWTEGTATFEDVFSMEHDRKNSLNSLANYLDSGSGVVLDVMSNRGGHCLTCWGYEKNAADEFIGIYVTDSDDPAVGPRYYQVERDTTGQQEWGRFKGWWYFTYYKHSTRYLIATVYGLARRSVPSAPQNFTID